MDIYGWTELTRAVCAGDISEVRQIVKGGADPNIANSAGNTPLIYAAMGGLVEMLKVLLPVTDDINARSHKQWTALHWCSSMGYSNCVELLLDNGADPNIPDSLGDTPLQKAIWSRNVSIRATRALIQAGSDLDTLHFETAHRIDNVGRDTWCKRVAILEMLTYVRCRPSLVHKLINIGYVPQNFVENNEHIKEMFSIIKHRLKSKWRLDELCRHQIRKTLQHDIRQKISELKLPTTLKDYVDFHDLDCYESNYDPELLDGTW